jgi:hypothetical protein
MTNEVYNLAGEEISVWLDSCGAVMLKVNSKSRDPVELGEGELEELIEILTKLYKEMTS